MRQTKLMLAFLAILTLAATGCAKLQARDNLNKGVQAFKDTHYEKSVEYFKKAIELDPDLTNAELYLASAYAQQFVPGGRGDENEKNAKLAVQTFEDVLKRDPNNVNAVAGLAGLYQNTNDYKKAHEYYVKYASLDSTNPVPFYAIGSLDWIIVFDKNNTDSKEDQLKTIDEGLSNLDKALALNPEYEDAMTYKNLLYRQKADRTDDEAEKKKLTAQADDWFNKALETRKKNAEKKKALSGN
ncbi:MAG TPA: tetratricopeptide repeat protein [Terriglobia bacterium]|nr:tetratricopeptide repeat protein [Terriglobia bacterium]